jgi:glycosyltransferase involved in cell wall biosynthesis
MAFELRAILRRSGSSEIFARYIAPPLYDDVHRITDYRPHHTRNVIVFHASMGQPEVHAFLMTRREPIVVMYHNVTPAHYFARYDALFEDLLALGPRELADLRARASLAIADSEYNAQDLRALGYEDVRVIPPLVDARRLLRVEPDAGTANHLNVAFDGPILLSVGQLMPHKRPDFLVQAMHIAATYLGSNAHLLLVGHQRLERYTRAVREQIRQLNLPRVHLVGPVEDSNLRAYSEAATAVVSASEHEGFGVPLVEAMAFGKPLLARASAAVPETVGDAALLVPIDGGPELYAEGVVELLGDVSLQQELVSRGRRRVEQLDARRTEAALLGALLEVV